METELDVAGISCYALFVVSGFVVTWMMDQKKSDVDMNNNEYPIKSLNPAKPFDPSNTSNCTVCKTTVLRENKRRCSFCKNIACSACSSRCVSLSGRSFADRCDIQPKELPGYLAACDECFSDMEYIERYAM